MKRQTFGLNSHDGRTRLHGVVWRPEGEPKAVLQLVHGMVEYIERYDGFASYMAQQGFLVVGHDHLGHGESIVTKEDYGYFEEMNGNRVLLEDIHQIRKIYQDKYPDLPYLILGHSMGSFLVRQYLYLYGQGLQGAAILGTGDMSREVLRFGMFLTSAMAAHKGWRHRSKLVQAIAFGSYNKRFKPRRTNCDWICSEESVVDEYVKGEKTTFIFTLNGFYNLFYSLYCLTNKSYLERMPKSLPVLFAWGEEDPVGDYGKGVRRVIRQFQEVGMEQVDTMAYPGCRHEILNEKNRMQVYEDIGGWLEEKAGI